MDNHNNQSRVDKFAKRRKNTKLLSIMLVIGGVLLVFLVVTLFFGGSDTEKADKETPANKAVMDDTDDSDDETSEDEDQSEKDDEKEDDDGEKKEDDDTDNDEVKKEKVDTPDDDNVVEAYKGDWKPVGTEQEGEHTMNFDDGTPDRIEMEEAARTGAELDEGNMITWRVERGGDQKVIATVSDEDDSKTSRVYLNWVDEKGWKPTKVEVLKENDKK